MGAVHEISAEENGRSERSAASAPTRNLNTWHKKRREEEDAERIWHEAFLRSTSFFSRRGTHSQETREQCALLGILYCTYYYYSWGWGASQVWPFFLPLYPLLAKSRPPRLCCARGKTNRSFLLLPLARPFLFIFLVSADAEEISAAVQCQSRLTICILGSLSNMGESGGDQT